MPLVVLEVPSVHRVALTVRQSGMTVTTEAGSFHMNEELMSLGEDTDAALTADATYDTNVVGYLARERESGAVVLAVDEVLQDGDDAACVWVEYEPLYPLFSLVVPAGATSLDGVRIEVQHLVAPKAREKHRAPASPSEPEARTPRGGE